MRLVRLSYLSILGCLLGLIALVAVAVDSGHDIRAKRVEMAELFDLRARVDGFSAASDSLVLLGADPPLLAYYIGEAESLETELAALAARHPDAGKAAHLVHELSQSVEQSVTATPQHALPRAHPGDPDDPTAPARVEMGQVANHGVALDTTLDDVLRERRRAIERDVTRTGLVIIAAALLFGVVAFIAFWLLYRRVAAPASELTRIIERVRAGDEGARARVSGNDELAWLAGAFNDLLDEQAETRAALRRREEMLAASQRIASIGSWRMYLDDQRVEWSLQTYAIFGVERGTFVPSLGSFEERVHPDDRDQIRARFEALAAEGGTADYTFRMRHPERGQIWVRAVAERVDDDDGRPAYVDGVVHDISVQKSAEEEANRLERRLAAMFGSITDGVVALDRQWRYTFVNAEAERLLGAYATELLGRVVWEVFPDLAGAQMGRALREAMREHTTQTVEERYEPLDRWFDIRVYPWDEGVAVYFRDVTERHEMMAQLRSLLETRRALINSLPAHIALLDGDGVIIDVNAQWREFARENDYANPSAGLGENYLAVCDRAGGVDAEAANAVATGLRAILAGERDSFAVEYPCHPPDGERWFRVAGSGLTLEGDNGTSRGAVVMHVDISERKLAELRLNQLAFEDPLTGQLSRVGFTREGDARCDASWPEAGLVAVLDIVGQRDLNEAHGYDAGDRILREFGRRLAESVGEDGFVGRIGGDEFAVFAVAAQPRALVGGLADGLGGAWQLEDLRVDVNARMGYTLLGDERRSADLLLREAELALADARRPADGSLPAASFTPELGEAVHRRIEMTTELREALTAQQFELHFQPKVELADGGLIGCEALIRWHHPERGLQPPGRFIPVAEQSQLIGPIGDWALREACRMLRSWRDDGLEVVQMSVNVSRVQFMLGDFSGKVFAALEDFGVEPGGLSLEITETVFERESEPMLAQMRALHDMGVHLSLDDFGTGYSSLLYLQKYPFDEIKIDQGFVRDILDDEYSREVVSTVMGFARALGATAVAEGIETEEVRRALVEMGCTVGQGYYFGMPLEAEDFRWLLERRSTLPVAGGERP